MLVNGGMESKKAKGKWFGLLVRSTKENFSKMNLKAKVKWYIQMERFLLDIGDQVDKMVMVQSIKMDNYIRKEFGIWVLW